MMRRVLGILLFVVSLPIGAMVVGCQCEPHVVVEEFESFCDGAPCNWEVLAGSVTQVPTFHEDLHGVSIPAGARIQSLQSYSSSAPRVLARCDAGATLRSNEGEPVRVSAERFEWVYIGNSVAQSEDNIVLAVTGSGQCIVDEVGFNDESCPSF